MQGMCEHGTFITVEIINNRIGLITEGSAFQPT